MNADIKRKFNVTVFGDADPTNSSVIRMLIVREAAIQHFAAENES